jgi:hypothetical protein
VAHTCNPSYSGGRDQEDCGLKPAWANSSTRPYLIKTLHKNRAGGVAQGEPLSSNPVPQKKKKNILKTSKHTQTHRCYDLGMRKNVRGHDELKV